MLKMSSVTMRDCQLSSSFERGFRKCAPGKSIKAIEFRAFPVIYKLPKLVGAKETTILSMDIQGVPKKLLKSLLIVKI